MKVNKVLSVAVCPKQIDNADVSMHQVPSCGVIGFFAPFSILMACISKRLVVVSGKHIVQDHKRITPGSADGETVLKWLLVVSRFLSIMSIREYDYMLL